MIVLYVKNDQKMRKSFYSKDGQINERIFFRRVTKAGIVGMEEPAFLNCNLISSGDTDRYR